MRHVVLVVCGLLAIFPVAAEQSSRLDQVLDSVIANERELAVQMREYQPLVETYLQTVKPHPTLGTVPVKDNYFFGRFVIPEGETAAPETKEERRAKKANKKKKSLTLFDDFHSATFQPERFARMLIVDRGSFDREHYNFDFIRSEFLGEVRTLVFDITPRKDRALNKLRTGRFTGRIWVEDEDFHIVRFNGVYASILTMDFHFDSWRLNMAPGLWLPAYVYTEESERALKQLKLTHTGQTRIWGYDVKKLDMDDEFTKVLIEAAQTDDRSESVGQISPVESARAWESEAEENVLQRLQRAGLLAPDNEVDKVLQTVVANLEITNELDVQPPIRCRVLLTTPLESFTVGHTIVLSRGLIDVLPDEASLAMVLAHEMGHILSGHDLDTRYAFSDQILIGDKQALEQFVFERDPEEEKVADDRAVQLLENSPYGDDLDNAGLFLKALASKVEDLPALIRPHFGSRMAKGNQVQRMTRILEQAPELDPNSLEQTAAMPLGGRVKLNPWNAHIELMKNTRVALLSPREKMPFQVTPLMPYLARYTEESDPLVDGVASESQKSMERADTGTTGQSERSVAAAGSPE